MSVSAAEKVDGVKPIEMIATDKNEYFTVTPNVPFVNVTKEGYYAVVYTFTMADNTTVYVPMTSKESFIDLETHDKFESSLDKAKVFNQCAVGDTLYIRTSAGLVDMKEKYYVVYSKDGETTDAVLSITPTEYEYMSVDESIVPVFADSKLSEASDKAIYSANLSTTGGYLGSVEVRYLRDGSYSVLDNFSYVDEKIDSASFEYTIIQNGTYEIWCYSSDGSVTTETVEVNCIDTTLVVDDPFTDSEPPKLTIETPSATGLTEGVDICAIKVKADEACDIGVGTFSESEVTEFTGYVYSNGVYVVTAKDSWGNVTTEEVKITAFGDGSLPGEGSDEDDTIGIVGLANDNPLNGSNRDSYWASAGEDDSVSGGSSVLPQTGSPTWFAMVAGIAAVTATAGGIAVKKSGILKRRKGDTKR